MSNSGHEVIFKLKVQAQPKQNTVPFMQICTLFSTRRFFFLRTWPGHNLYGYSQGSVPNEETGLILYSGRMISTLIAKLRFAGYDILRTAKI